MAERPSKKTIWLSIAGLAVLVAIAVGVLLLAGATATAFTVAVAGVLVLGFGVLMFGADLFMGYRQVQGRRRRAPSRLRSH
jgi:hypothetical protein